METGVDARKAQRAPGKKRNQYLGCLTVSMFAMCMGSFMGWTSAAQRLQTGALDFNVTAEQYSWIGALMPLGAMVSALPTGHAAQVLGRKLTLMALLPVLIGAWLLIIFANSAVMIMIGRFVGGAVVGSISLVAPMYCSEVPEDSLRSSVGTYFQLLHTVGVLFAYILASTVESLTLITVIIACIPVVVSVLFFPFFPDTPRWYLYKGREAKAKEALIFYRGEHYDVDSEISEILAVLKKEEEEKVGWREALKNPSVTNPSGLLAAVVVAVVSQFSGVSAVVFYAADIFKSAGVDSITPDDASIIMGACLVLGTLASTGLTNFVGVRMLLHISGLSCVVCDVVLGVYMYYLGKDKSSVEGLGWLPILTMSLFMILFSIGYGPIPWTYMSNVVANKVKSVFMPVANITFWLSVFLTTKFYDDLRIAVGSGATFWIFGAFVMFGVVFAFLYVMELKGKGTEQIQDELAARKHKTTPRPGA